MAERVDGDEGQVLLALAQVLQRVGKRHAVSRQEIHVLYPIQSNKQ